MAFTLWFGVLAFTIVYLYLLDRRYRLLALDEDREDRELQAAIAERVGSAATRTPAIAEPVEAPEPVEAVTPQ